MNQFNLQTDTLTSTDVLYKHRFGPWQIFGTTNAPSTVGTAHQIHGGNIVRSAGAEGDGIITDGSQVVGVYTADCVPLIITGDACALALHVSRKSIVHGLLDNVLTYIDPADILHVFIGPHICEYHFAFEIERPLLRRFRYRFPEATHFYKGRMYVSLRKALQHYVIAWGVHPDRILEDGRCTYEMNENVSYRRARESDDTTTHKRLFTYVQRAEK